MKDKIKFFSKVYRDLAIYSGGIFLIFPALITSCANYSLATKQQSTPAITENSASHPPQCQTEQLSVRKVSTNAGAGNVVIIYAFTNKSSSPCNLYGYPEFVLLDSNNQPLKGVKVIRSQNTYSSQQKSPHVTLGPNAQASFDIAYNHIQDIGQSCPTSVKIQITPPNADRYFTLTEKINACTGKVRVRPIQPGIIQ
ncbi:MULTISPECIES: DUF4232 domain-containing protein [Nostoc]|uniref:DUF4232 domain-containing protein n=1 Tax=Nostoc paludosum FACHB-159 TaxID=2692908 RepID=A0ABR8KE45_9NOSO|nr:MULTISPECIES: DUF4232 domain-containing protein [Nostoc]MBD2680646.1 DUF4232 domain-containing protein [Nostoc sp. FACHB-857]MBD2737041.1 DUF4232 domain-containing protein [Nostoc paludosum FACHB-159]